MQQEPAAIVKIDSTDGLMSDSTMISAFTGEIINLIASPVDCDFLDMDQLMGAYSYLTAACAQANSAKGVIAGEIERRMEADGATLAIGHGYEAVKKHVPDWKLDEGALEIYLTEMKATRPELSERINKAMAIGTVRVVKFNKTHLNALARLGDAIKATLDGFTTDHGRDRIIITPRKEEGTNDAQGFLSENAPAPSIAPTGAGVAPDCAG